MPFEETACTESLVSLPEKSALSPVCAPQVIELGLAVSATRMEKLHSSKLPAPSVALAVITCGPTLKESPVATALPAAFLYEMVSVLAA